MVHGILMYWGSLGPRSPGGLRGPGAPGCQDWVPLFYHALARLDCCFKERDDLFFGVCGRK